MHGAGCMVLNIVQIAMSLWDITDHEIASFRKVTFRTEKKMPSLNAHVEQRLRTDQIVWLTTVRPDGRPHVVPVGFFWDGQTFLICSEPNTLSFV